ncbi:Pilus assembly protein TadG [Cupriavidus taiwanensis]|uniref:TadE/TadG family type IV pilus assembly protein n=1 Tax=Cupriavidus taiwanensis TaxID=164546 RepID=UPI000E19D271|nr:TadE/TadG family type IV pilus assembly protein [Cupriavidus taiwanensis]SOZ15384.1 Pilus assembly protein TadG [Cupriavidus taiwanensis]SOZ27628.1 Pilus assembly protein TadG [Cupriavidus taiwanensis]SOZ45955.1 Pilus assembly protein TadG [Cupriavidus taiwanensis]
MTRLLMLRKQTRKPSARRQRGVAAVEFGILLAPMVLMACGVAEFGRAIYQYDTLTKATRTATRYLSQFSPDDVGYPAAAAKCLAVYGNSACSGDTLAPGLSTSMVVICDRVDASGCPGQSFSNVNTYDNPGGAGTPAGTVNLVAVRITGFAYSPLQSFIDVSGLTFSDITTVMRQVL